MNQLQPNDLSPSEKLARKDIERLEQNTEELKQVKESMTPQPSKRDWEFITAVCDDLVADLGLEPDGHRTWAKTTDEIIKEVESELKEKLPSLLSHIREEAERAFGGCKKCYGKGYATTRYGRTVSGDFFGDEGYEVAPQIYMMFCSCDRGKQLKSLLSTLKPKEVI